VMTVRDCRPPRGEHRKRKAIAILGTDGLLQEMSEKFPSSAVRPFTRKPGRLYCCCMCGSGIAKQVEGHRRLWVRQQAMRLAGR
jgi:hypothetical protein